MLKIAGRRTILGLIILLIGTAALFVLFQNHLQPGKEKPKPPFSRISLSSEADVKILADKNSDAGTGTDSIFILSSKLPLKEKELRQSLKIIPEIPVKIKKRTETEWKILPQKPLEKGKIYRFILHSLIKSTQAQDLSWAFQIETPIEISGSLPADKATNVPLNTSIEIYFNNPQFSQWEKYFEINPKVEGRFEKHQNTLIFIPKNLSPATIYTVKLKKGLPLEDGSETLKEDFVFQFETGRDNKTPVKRFEFSRILFEANPKSTPTILLNNWELPNNPAKIKAYQVGQDQFLQCLKEKNSLPSWSRMAQSYHRCPTPSQPSLDLELEIKREAPYGQYYLEFPESLNPGFWIIEIENPQSNPSQTLVEVTPLAWYFWLGDKNSLFWVLNLDEQNPAAGTTVEINNQPIGQTNNQGVIQVKTLPELRNRKNALLSLKQGKWQAFSPINFSSGSSWSWQYQESKTQIEANNYWSYLYLDRQIYLPRDKVQLWGLVKDRSNQKIDRLKIKLIQGIFKPWLENFETNTTLIEEKEVALSSTGTFTSSFNLQDLPTGYYSLGLFLDDILITQKGFTVQTFQKSAYKIGVQPEKLVLWAGEKNKIKVKAEFWDGTPVTQTTLVWSCYQSDQKGEVTTNTLGEAEISIATDFDPNQNSWPRVWTVRLHPKLPEEAEIEASTSFFVFGPQIELSGETNWQDGQGIAEIKANKINLAERQTNPWERGGPPANNLKVKVSIYHYWYEKIETGDRYNPIEKTVEKAYRFEKREEKIGQKEIITNEQGKAHLSFPAEEKKFYRLEFSASDERGKEAKLILYLYGNCQGGYQQEQGFNLTANKTQFKLNDPVKITLLNNGESAPQQAPNHYLIFATQNGKIVLKTVQNANEWQFQFQPEFIPNIHLKAVWFTGQTLKETRDWSSFWGKNTNLRFDSGQKRLTVNLQPQKSSYQPGEKAKIDLAVTNQNNQPSKKSRVLISIVDEALSDLGAIEKPNILNQLYHDLGTGKLLSYCSHPLPKVGGAEGGGGGGARENLENTALFTEIETDNNGKATIEFQLPDNITSWRLSAIAVNNELEAGDSQLLLPVSKPIFVRIISAHEFLTKDKPKIKAVAFGKILNPADQVHYTVKAPSLGIEKLNLDQKAFIPIEFEPAKLETGQHEIEIWAYARGKRDGLVQEIEIINSRLLRPRTEFQELENEFVPSWPTQKAAKVIIIDKSRGYWYPQLQTLAQTVRFGPNERADRVTGQIKARQLLHQFFGDNIVSNEEDIASYQSSGGFSLLPYGDSDLILSAKIAALKLSQTNKIKLKKYFWETFNQTNSIEAASAALWGLAELDEPVLTIINQLSQQENTPLGRLYLGLASSALGDQALARELWQLVGNEFARQEQPFVYLEIGQSKEEWLKNTALGMILAARINSNLFEGMVQYLDDNPSQENIFVIEKLLTIQAKLTNSPTMPGSFEYWLGGKKFKKELAAGETEKIIIPPDQLQQFKIKPIKGKLSLIGQWWEALDQNAVKKSAHLKLNLTVSPTSQISQSEIVEIKLQAKIDPHSLTGPYLVRVNLPSGLRFINAPYSRKKDNYYYSWPINQEGNTLQFWASTDYPIRFLARPVNRGTFIFEPAIIYHATATDFLNLSAKPHDVIIK